MKKDDCKVELFAAFHCMWDGFPGPVRLIDKKHTILAANPIAIKKGFEVGMCCAKVGEPCSHKGCKSAALLLTHTAQMDQPDAQRIRGWVPLENYPDVYVHYTLMLPGSDI